MKCPFKSKIPQTVRLTHSCEYLLLIWVDIFIRISGVPKKMFKNPISGTKQKNKNSEAEVILPGSKKRRSVIKVAIV